MTFQYRPARDVAAEADTPLIIGLSGPSGGGKTKSALELAVGIQSVVGGEIAAIDTEARRMLRYAKRPGREGSEYYDFKYLEFEPPFSSLRYAEALTAAVDSGVKTVIIDSMSHEHEGPGGYLMFHETELDRLAGKDERSRRKNTFTAWIKPAADRRFLINTMLQKRCNFILCFRAKEKLDLSDSRAPKKLGFQPIAGEEFVFEMTTMVLLPERAMGVPDWTLQAAKLEAHHRFAFRDGEPITQATGALLARWAKGELGERESARAGTSEAEIEVLKKKGFEAAAQGVEAFRKFWTNPLVFAGRAQQDMLRPLLSDFQRAAMKADEEFERGEQGTSPPPPPASPPASPPPPPVEARETPGMMPQSPPASPPPPPPPPPPPAAPETGRAAKPSTFWKEMSLEMPPETPKGAKAPDWTTWRTKVRSLIESAPDRASIEKFERHNSRSFANLKLAQPDHARELVEFMDARAEKMDG